MTLNKITLIIGVLIIIPHNASGDDWDNWDKSLYITHQLAKTVDMFQTQNIYRNKEYRELNPVIDSGVNKFGTHFIPVYFLGSAVAEYIVADVLKAPYRKMFLTTGTLFTIGLIQHNKSIGLGLSIKF